MQERPFSKVLIANRGEIAVRIMRTCREMGIGTIAVYSDADERAMHVQQADEAYRIGPAPALESYLSMDAVLTAARESGADAIHPGYGFLAENDVFARAVADAGLAWIGPPADVIAHMGDKVAAKGLARTAGVPVVPGYDGSDQSLERMTEEAGHLGYPVMLKAAAGGGGKGMRAVTTADELPAALEGARREARSAFGDDRVFLEKLIVKPRHVEIQILMDAHGNGIYLGERDCSIQRRHQKVVEEAPSPILTRDLRVLMGAAALRLAHIGGYVNAGTVEFLFSGDAFYFLEMNTRIQVEHPVTEMVTGLDLIRLQIEIAAGWRLPLSQLEVETRGHAIEVRLYAEDAANRFLPVTGRISAFDPPAGPGIRNDLGVFEGATVSQYYDPMLAKLIVHAETRAEAVSRLRRALESYVVLGLTTNLGFLHWIASQTDFENGRADIAWLDEQWHPAPAAMPPRYVILAAAVFEALTAAGAERGSSDPYSPWHGGSGWREPGIARSFAYYHDGQEIQVQLLHRSESDWVARLDGDEERVRVIVGAPHQMCLILCARVLHFSAVSAADAVWVGHAGSVYALERADRSRAHISRPGRTRGQAQAVAPMPGTVIKVVVTEGQTVDAHEPLMVLEAMKMEHVLEAPHAGVVRAILFGVGEMVPAGAPVVELEEL